MSILDKFKKKFEKKQSKTVPEKVARVKTDAKSSGDSAVLKEKAGKDKALAKDKQKVASAKAEVKDKTGSASQVILRPLQTEKVTDQMTWGQYTFEVATGTNKSEIKKAIKAIYNVEPARVNIVNLRGKAVRFGRIWSKRKNWKKAIVTLKPGDKIEVYEGV